MRNCTELKTLFLCSLSHIKVKKATHLNCTELLVDYLDHTLDLFGCDGAGATLLAEKIHDVGSELVAALVVLLDLLLVDGSDLSKFIFVV